MSERDFFRDDAKTRVTEAIRALEKQTSAELVVAVHHRSASYRHADYLAGFVLAWLVLVALLFLPQEFALWSFPVDVAIAFAGGALAIAHVPSLRRILTPAKDRDAAVRAAACEAFVRLGVANTSRRTGILAYVSTFERRAMVIADVGVDAKTLGEPWRRAVAAIEAAGAACDFPRFVAAIGALGAALSTTYPHHDGDANELPDEVDAA